MDDNTKFPITCLTRGDIVEFFKIRYKGSAKQAKIIKKIKNFTDSEMKHLASKMENDYIDAMFWASLEHHIESFFGKLER